MTHRDCNLLFCCLQYSFPLQQHVFDARSFFAVGEVEWTKAELSVRLDLLIPSPKNRCPAAESTFGNPRHCLCANDAQYLLALWQLPRYVALQQAKPKHNNNNNKIGIPNSYETFCPLDDSTTLLFQTRPGNAHKIRTCPSPPPSS